MGREKNRSDNSQWTGDGRKFQVQVLEGSFKFKVLEGSFKFKSWFILCKRESDHNLAIKV